MNTIPCAFGQNHRGNQLCLRRAIGHELLTGKKPAPDALCACGQTSRDPRQCEVRYLEKR